MLKLPFLRKPVPLDLKQPQPVRYPNLSTVEFAARYHGARVGGDFFDVLTLEDRLIFLLLDIAGQREFALNVAAIVQIVFREAAEELFSSHDANEADALTQLALAINRGIIEITGIAHFCTGFFGCYRESMGTLTYINAGSPPALLRDTHGVAELPGHGLPLGLFLHATQDAQIIVLEPGAVLMLYSRGIMEARNRRKEFGIRRVRQMLVQSSASDANDIANELLSTVKQHSSGSQIDNDLTTIVLRRKFKTAAAQS